MELVQAYQVVARRYFLFIHQQRVGHVFHAAVAHTILCRQCIHVAFSRRLIQPRQHAMHLVEHKRVRTEYQHILERLADGGNQVRLARARGMHHAGAVCGLERPHYLLVCRLVMIIKLGSHIA